MNRDELANMRLHAAHHKRRARDLTNATSIVGLHVQARAWEEVGGFVDRCHEVFVCMLADLDAKAQMPISDGFMIQRSNGDYWAGTQWPDWKWTRDWQHATIIPKSAMNWLKLDAAMKWVPEPPF
jgi:hypothetical protein